MADEYISKQRAKDLMGCCLASTKAQYKAEKNEFRKARYGDYISTIQAMIDVVGAVEAADVQFIRHGRWIDIHEYCKMNGYIPSGVAVYYWCSECMNEQEKTSDFCPCCGANMREPEAIKG